MTVDPPASSPNPSPARPPASPPVGSLARRLQAKYGDALEYELSIALSLASDASKGAGRSSPPPAIAAQCPAGLLRYEVGSEIARGGMGAILEVWDRDLARTLAMKVLLDPRESAKEVALVQRFVREARITGQLDHPGIVPVHDLGIDESGRVYFTMRLVRGQDLGRVFMEARAGSEGWTHTRALEVLLKICDTVAFAHSRGVVHRDLKPANVMVGDFGEVYVLDWGLAKVVDAPEPDPGASDPGGTSEHEFDAGATLAGTVLGTPSYMPPEQAEGLGHRAYRQLDVYSLGAMLYTLLVGHPPYVSPGRPTSTHELLAAVRRGPPPSVRELASEVSSELGDLCDRAMARDPEQRFESAAALATALRAHLESERLAAEESRRLRGQLEDARGVATFLKGLFRVETPADAEKPVSLMEILERGAAQLDQNLADQPAMRASVHATLGDVHNQIGTHGRALPHLEEAVRWTRANLTMDARATLAHRLTSLGQVLYQNGRYEAAEQSLIEAVALWREVAERGEPLARALSSLSSVRWTTGRPAEGVPCVLEALELRRALPDPVQLSNSLVDLGVLRDSLGDFSGGEAAYLEALAIRERVLGPEHASVATVLINLGALACYRGDFATGADRYRAALEIRRGALGPRHPKVGLAMINLGYALGRVGRLDEAESVLRDALALRLEILDPEHPEVGHALDTLGAVLTEKGELAEAETSLSRARAVAERRAGKEHPLHGWIAASFSRLRERQGRLEDAEAELRRAIAHDLPPGAPLTAHTIDHTYELAGLFMRTARYAEAAELLAQCLPVYERSFRPSDPITVECARQLRLARAQR